MEIFNWRRLTDRLTTSGQPSEAQLAELKALGVDYVINLGLHSHEKALADEAASVTQLGMRYVHIPVDFQCPTEEDFSQFCAAMAEIGDANVHVHCILNARVSAFVYRYQRDILHMDEETVRAEMETIWRPGGIWARFIGDEAGFSRPHQYVGLVD